MQRISVGKIRDGWQETVANAGLVYNVSVNARGEKFSYWEEGAHYIITESEQLRLKLWIEQLHEMCVEAGQYMIKNPSFMEQMGIPECMFEAILMYWDREFTPNAYGRFDLCYNGEGPPKLLEYNANTPTALLEAADIQWTWFEQTHGFGPGENRLTDQWNEIFDSLVAAWKLNINMWELHASEESGQNRFLKRVHLFYSDADQSGEDLMTVNCMAAAVQQAIDELEPRRDIEVVVMPIQQFGFHANGKAYDLAGRHIDLAFALYPWEWMVNETFAPNLVANQAMGYEGTTFVEPPYTMLWSNKALLVALWRLFGDDPEKSQLLLPAYFEGETHTMKNWVHKPLLGREGANTTIVLNGETAEETSGEYGEEGYVVQQYCELPRNTDMMGVDRIAVVGAWMVQGRPVGLGVREDRNLITGNLGGFVPIGMVSD